MSTAAQIAANQANSQHSTGPTTAEGKAASAKNRFRHGLSGAFVIQSWENADEYDQLLDGLRDEHRPATSTEALLVERMAQHWWLGQRALRLQECCFHNTAPMIQSGNEKEFALALRYQTTHERAFSKCLNDLTKLRVEQLKAAERLERLALAARGKEAAEARQTELHQARLQSLEAKTKLDEAKAAKTAAAPAFRPAASLSFADVFAEDAAREAELQAFLNKNKAA